MDLLIGRRLGKYQVLEELGSGGMGIVYKGYDPSLDRIVAIKVLYPHLTREQAFVERFLREARAAAQIKHPNIVTIHDVGHAVGRYYFVMEYLEGISLKALLKQQRILPRKEILTILGQLANTLDYAHKKGLIHRDVKPGNVVISPEGSVTLTDFGIAKVAHQPPPPLRSFRPDLPEGVESVMTRILAKEPRARYPSGAAFLTALEQALPGKAAEPLPAGVGRPATAAGETEAPTAPTITPTPLRSTMPTVTPTPTATRPPPTVPTVTPPPPPTDTPIPTVPTVTPPPPPPTNTPPTRLNRHLRQPSPERPLATFEVSYADSIQQALS